MTQRERFTTNEQAIKKALESFNLIDKRQYGVELDFELVFDKEGELALKCTPKVEPNGESVLLTYSVEMGRYHLIKRNGEWFDWEDKMNACSKAQDGEEELADFTWDYSYVPKLDEERDPDWLDILFYGNIVWFIWSEFDMAH